MRAGEKEISGGSSDSEEKDWQVKPIGPSGPCAVITTTPDTKCPNTSRMICGVTGCGVSWALDGALDVMGRA
ncbi:hypothetical protein GCM10023175_39380 [Pseudonocardia xishanensis]|uniref:Uncharacterized protein n=1 Tax=Pseudonocardia xishanensis TaxID=630995 RepID=A0ABP8RUP8_9PSEU